MSFSKISFNLSFSSPKQYLTLNNSSNGFLSSNLWPLLNKITSFAFQTSHTYNFLSNKVGLHKFSPSNTKTKSVFENLLFIFSLLNICFLETPT